MFKWNRLSPRGGAVFKVWKIQKSTKKNTKIHKKKRRKSKLTEVHFFYIQQYFSLAAVYIQTHARRMLQLVETIVNKLKEKNRVSHQYSSYEYLRRFGCVNLALYMYLCMCATGYKYHLHGKRERERVPERTKHFILFSLNVLIEPYFR